MTWDRINLRKQVALIIDSSAIILAFFLSYYLRKPFKNPPFHELGPLGEYFWLLVVTLPFSWISLLLFGVYSNRPSAGKNFLILFGRIGLSMIVVFGLIFFLFDLRQVNRTLVIPFIFLSALLGALWRTILIKWERTHGATKRALLVGEGEKLSSLVKELQDNQRKGFELVGIVTDEPIVEGQRDRLRVLGKLDDLYNLLHQEVVDEVIFGVPISALEHYRPSIEVCKLLGASVLILIEEQWTRFFSRVDVGKLSEHPFLYLATTPADDISALMKAILDRIIGFLVLTVTFPLFIIIPVLIKFSSRGPVFFIQDRTGLNGRKFRMFKFRTMTVDAAQKKLSLQQMNEMAGPVFKIKNDPRITRIGALLRKYSLDELPQFINVLKGDMSLVGPRPLPCEEAAMIHGAQRRRFSVKPGMTCIWQISGRNHLSYEEWMKLDLQYIEAWSLGLDFKILLKTPGAVLSSKGAF